MAAGPHNNSTEIREQENEDEPQRHAPQSHPAAVPQLFRVEQTADLCGGFVERVEGADNSALIEQACGRQCVDALMPSEDEGRTDYSLRHST